MELIATCWIWTYVAFWRDFVEIHEIEISNATFSFVIVRYEMFKLTIIRPQLNFLLNVNIKFPSFDKLTTATELSFMGRRYL